MPVLRCAAAAFALALTSRESLAASPRVRHPISDAIPYFLNSWSVIPDALSRSMYVRSILMDSLSSSARTG